MSIKWYKIKIKKQSNEYECFIRYKFDFQMQTIRIKAFIYLTDSDGNISLSEKKNKLGYDPRILGSLTIEKNFLKLKRRNNSNDKPLYFQVMKYQGNFNICNLPLIDDYFRNGKALICQYKDLLYLMDNKKYKIQMTSKVFTIILDIINYGYISLNLFNKLEDVEKQELIFLQQDEEALCHRYFSNKFNVSLKNKRDTDEIEIIEENKNFNQLGGRICIGGEENENINIEYDNNKKEIEDNYDYYFDENDKDYDINSDDSSVYDHKFLINGNENNEKLIINNNKIYINGKDFNNNNNTPKCNIILNGIKNPNKKNSKSKSRLSNLSFNNNENYNNLFIKIKKEDKNIIKNSKIQINSYSNKNLLTNSKTSKKELNSLEKSKNIVNENNYLKDINNNNQNIINNKNFINNENNKDFNLLYKRMISKKIDESLISNEAERKILLCSSGFDNNKYDLKILYKSSINGDNILIFRNRCFNIKNIFLIILTLDNKKIGFYTSVGLSTDKELIYDNNAFLFKLSKAEMDCFHIKNSEIASYGYKDYILYLGGEQLIIRDKFLSAASSCGTKMKNYKINTNYQLNNGNKNFIIKELEAYTVFKI